MTEPQSSNVDWNDVIRQAFFDAWSDNSPVDITSYSYKIGHHFNLDLIVKNLQISLMDSDDKIRDIEYHTNRLRVLAEIFVLALLAVSDDGKILTAHNIEIAKHTLLNKGKCNYE